MAAREHDGGTAAERLHPLDDEQHALLAGEGGDVVRVRVGEAEGAPRPTVLQPHPGADARARRTPALASGNVRRLRQPERAALQGLEAVFPIEDGRGFVGLPVGPAVFAHESIFRQLFAQVGRLFRAYLLKPKRIKVELSDECDKILPTRLPGVGRAPVARSQADVVGANPYFLRCRMVA